MKIVTKYCVEQTYWRSEASLSYCRSPFPSVKTIWKTHTKKGVILFDHARTSQRGLSVTPSLEAAHSLRGLLS